VGAGAPANTGAAGATHRVACFAGMPAPTGSPPAEGMHHTLWERVHPRTPAQPVPSTASPASRACPLPQGPRQLRNVLYLWERL